MAEVQVRSTCLHHPWHAAGSHLPFVQKPKASASRNHQLLEHVKGHHQRPNGSIRPFYHLSTTFASVHPDSASSAYMIEVYP